MPLSIKVANMSNCLTYYERQMLEYWFKTKQSMREISRIMRRDHSVLVRELKRNGSGVRKRYRADIAQKLFEKRLTGQHLGKLDKCLELRQYVEGGLKKDWSPEQIVGRLKKDGLKQTISHESIYYYIYHKAERYKKLHLHLRTNRKKRKQQGKRKSSKVHIPQRVSVHERPKEIDTRLEFGHWESDTVEFKRTKNNPYISVQFERKSKLVRIRKMKNKTADETNAALINTIESVPNYLLKTITFDNGSENTKHLEIKNDYDIDTYFCDPFCSWQKGGVENTNKLIRQYLPRGIDMHKMTDYDIYLIQEKLNNRPRKSLNYLTPNEVINKVVR